MNIHFLILLILARLRDKLSNYMICVFKAVLDVKYSFENNEQGKKRHGV